MTNHRQSWWVMTVFVLMLQGLGPLLDASQAPRAQPPMMTTSDDPRRVPIPQPDRSQDPMVVLRGGTLIDGTEGSPIDDAVVVIQGNRVLEVGTRRSVTVPEQAQVVDVSGLYVLPGLIDLHVHFQGQRSDYAGYRDSIAAIAIRGVEKMGRLLDGGITTVREVGCPGDVPARLAEAVQRGIFAGPRIYWAGQMIASRGGHGDEITETASGRPKSLETSATVRVATGPDDWRLAVREQIRLGSHLIKLTAPFTREEVAAAVDEAHLHGLAATVDSFGEFSRWATEAGIDCIEHPLDLAPSTITLMAEKGTALVPTITAFYNPLTYGYPSAHIPPGGFFYTMSRRFPLTHEGHMETLRQARAAKLKVGIGTDIPFENDKRYPTDYFTELEFFKQAGYSHAEILAAATRIGGEILHMEDKLGTLQKGMLADVLVVSGNPLQDLGNLRNVRLVIADGRIVRHKLNGTSTSTAPTR